MAMSRREVKFNVYYQEKRTSNKKAMEKSSALPVDLKEIPRTRHFCLNAHIKEGGDQILRVAFLNIFHKKFFL